MLLLNYSEVSERSRQYRKLSMDKNRKTYYLYIQRKPGEKYERSIENFDKDYLVERGEEWKRLKLIYSWYVTYVGERFV